METRDVISDAVANLLKDIVTAIEVPRSTNKTRHTIRLALSLGENGKDLLSLGETAFEKFTKASVPEDAEVSVQSSAGFLNIIIRNASENDVNKVSEKLKTLKNS